jgi:protein gp37
VSTATSIEWTRGDDSSAGATWNPVTGCREVSEGCDHCYAKTFAERFRGVPGHPFEQGFDVKLWPERLSLPLRWRKARRVFVELDVGPVL